MGNRIKINNITSENINARVSVEPTDVINEGMIKKEII